MSLGNGNGRNGASRLVLPNGQPADRNAKDDQGRTLARNATVNDAHEIAIETGNKLHAFYLNQIPEFVARMVMDGLAAHGLLNLRECSVCGVVTRAAASPDPVPCHTCGSTVPLVVVGPVPMTPAPDAPPAVEGTPSATPPAASDAAPPV